MFKLLQAVLIFFVILSCGRSLDPSGKAFDSVDEALWVHFETFEVEAARRGVNIDLVALEITGVIENIQENGVAGTCQYGQHIHHVTVDKEVWDNGSTLLREYIVFHELGHCSLFRDHNDQTLSTGACHSIMASGLGGCNYAYTAKSRDRYLDELFGAL